MNTQAEIECTIELADRAKQLILNMLKEGKKPTLNTVIQAFSAVLGSTIVSLARPDCHAPMVKQCETIISMNIDMSRAEKEALN